ncbi:AGE family epimerase/isomerase [Ensifer adhaerens]|uniref:AGE family epimerase/isomerase n=1 Tax=Ensifer adhaerens TaxID=106592 RepID=UPI00131A0DEF|nr:AGE family epimerase/isomerase [Ensifer adhaerens]
MMHVKIATWLADHSIPRMLADGTDWSNGGFAERLDWAGRPLDPGFKRLRVTARQIYAFSHLGLGGSKEAVRAAEHGMEFLLTKARLGGGEFASRLTTRGDPLDTTTDLYDLAFVLFALAWWYKLTGEEDALSVAEDTLRFVRRKLGHPSGRGFLHRENARAPYQQNPHMHLLEAAIFLAAFSGRELFYVLAREIFELAVSDFFDPRTETLAEYYGDNWKRDAGSDPIVVEPGHHFEWCWLLTRYSALMGERSALHVAERLFWFGRKHGFDSSSGLIYDAVDPSGRCLKADFRSWPNLEYVKAMIAMSETYPGDSRFAADQLDEAIERIFSFFLGQGNIGGVSVPPGLWLDHICAADFSAKVDHIPASTFYHLAFAFTEVTRHRAGRHIFSGAPW